MPVDSSGSMNPPARPIATQFLTQNLRLWPILIFKSRALMPSACSPT